MTGAPEFTPFVERWSRKRPLLVVMLAGLSQGVFFVVASSVRHGWWRQNMPGRSCR
jgi:hypothetical protein